MAMACVRDPGILPLKFGRKRTGGWLGELPLVLCPWNSWTVLCLMSGVCFCVPSYVGHADGFLFKARSLGSDIRGNNCCLIKPLTLTTAVNVRL